MFRCQHLDRTKYNRKEMFIVGHRKSRELDSDFHEITRAEVRRVSGDGFPCRICQLQPGKFSGVHSLGTSVLGIELDSIV